MHTQAEDHQFKAGVERKLHKRPCALPDLSNNFACQGPYSKLRRDIVQRTSGQLLQQNEDAKTGIMQLELEVIYPTGCGTAGTKAWSA